MRFCLNHKASGLALLAGVFAAVASPQGAAAVTILSDDFAGLTGSPAGRSPNLANLPGRQYAVGAQSVAAGTQQPAGDAANGAPAPSLIAGFNHATFIDISSNGGYVKPTTLRISGDLQMNNIANDGQTFRGIGLGYYPAGKATTGEQSIGFTGLEIVPDGTLRLVNNGVGSSTVTASPITGFSTSTFYNLAYSVDTTTGSITNAVLNGTDVTGAFSGANTAGVFTDAKTHSAAIFAATATNAAFFGRADNFTLTDQVPEPASAGLLAASAIGLLARRRRRA
jgi:hypothetical protein